MSNTSELHQTVNTALSILKSGRAEQSLDMLCDAKRSRIPVRDLDFVRALCFIQLKRLFDARLAIHEELRYFPDNKMASQLLQDVEAELGPSIGLPNNIPVECSKIIGVIRPYTMVGIDRLVNLFYLTKAACENDIPGNFVECGVAAGGTSALIASTIKLYTKRPRTLFSVDSFSGMPVPTQADTHEGIPADKLGWGTGTCSAPENSVLEVSGLLGVTDIVRPVKGYFEDVLPKIRQEIGPIAMLHLDGDWYDSTIAILTNLYDQLSPGALLQVDDYGYWEGCRKAIHEFERSRNQSFKIHKIDDTGVWFQKP